MKIPGQKALFPWYSLTLVLNFAIKDVIIEITGMKLRYT